MKLSKMKEIREDLSSLEGNFDVVLFGSQVEGGARPTSDIDVAVLTHSRDQECNITVQKE